MAEASMSLSANRDDVLKDMAFTFSSWNKAGKLEPSTNNEVPQGLVSRPLALVLAHSLTHGRPKP